MPEGAEPSGGTPGGPAVEVVVDGRTVRVSNPDKVLYPTTGTTKLEVVRYYEAVGEWLVDHTVGRCVTLRRFPDGVDGDSFFTKRCPSHRPAWIPDAPGPGEPEGSVRYCVLDSPASLVWAANLAALEIHTPMALAADLDEPRACVFDLDPGPGTDVLDCARLALRIRDVLERFDLAAWPKTSGSKGLQVYVPLGAGATHEGCAEFALAVGQLLEVGDPDRVTTTRTRSERSGRVLVDWQQNARFATTVCAYSLRGRSTPTVSTPLTWDEVAGAAESGDASSLRFTATEVLDRLRVHGDVFAPVLTLEQSLPTPRR